MSLDHATLPLCVADVIVAPATMNVYAVAESPSLPTKSLDRATRPVDHEAKEVKPLDGGADASTKNRELEDESLDTQARSGDRSCRRRRARRRR
jgi:hypothetical protein